MIITNLTYEFHSTVFLEVFNLSVLDYSKPLSTFQKPVGAEAEIDEI